LLCGPEPDPGSDGAVTVTDEELLPEPCAGLAPGVSVSANDHRRDDDTDGDDIINLDPPTDPPDPPPKRRGPSHSGGGDDGWLRTLLQSFTVRLDVGARLTSIYSSRHVKSRKFTVKAQREARLMALVNELFPDPRTIIVVGTHK
jgi:hypothetical protein